MASETTTATPQSTKTHKRPKGPTVAETLAAYGTAGVPWADLVEPVQDALIQEQMVYYDKDRKCVCRACKCESKKHIGAETGCPVIGNTKTLDIVRIIDLCCEQAQIEHQVSTAVRAAIARGDSPLVASGANIQYTRPHYEAGESRYRLKKKASASSSSSKTARRRRQSANTTLPPDAPPPAAPTAPPVEAQVKDIVQQLANHVDNALVEANKRNDETIRNALSLLGEEMQALRNENRDIRAQAAQALEALTHRPDPLPVAVETSTAPSSVSNVPRVALSVPRTSQPQQRQQQQQKASAQAPLASSRSRKNIFQLPTAQAKTSTPLVAAPSPLYPPIQARSMAPRMQSLQGRVH
ncbi:hypothetical protein pclt_cds_488 [Pandoravirus celtis]|uniref:Uncharacterized protein n=1 Tax=Pandoravirus celtis TaxID=2568002 RepID=A0A4D6EI25_9VIRU|nr:hypothetical protein pclt_cds_488 [Pandoravirus celtis]